MKDHYQTLGVSRFATQEEIKTAYKKLTIKFHPDKNNGDKYFEERFKEVLDAYKILSNRERKEVYDKIMFSQKQSTTYTNVNKEPNYNTKHNSNNNKFEKKSLIVEIIKKALFGFILPILYRLSGLIIIFLVIGIFNLFDGCKKNKPEVANNNKDSKQASDTITSFHKPVFSPYEGNKLKNGESPYDSFFGKGKYDSNSLNKITFKNGNDYDAIVCLVDVKNDQTIRNEYINFGTDYTMTKIPDGTYYIKVFYGIDWNPNKVIGENIIGAFDTDFRFS